MPPSKKPKIGLVLSAGGARAAYQVGVLRYLGEAFPHFRPTIFTGVSAGSINACFLAQGDPFNVSSKKLFELWEKIQFDQVLHTNFKSFFSMGSRWAYDLLLSKLTKRQLLKSLLDATPLSQTLLSYIHFWKISRAVREGSVDGVAVSATNYHDGNTAIFYESHKPTAPWKRERRHAIHTNIRLRHVMASCSIPILFEPIRIGDHLYGDGSLRFSFPFSPAIHLGATHLLAIGIRSPNPKNALGVRPDRVSLGFVAGAILNSIFLDSVESDFENLMLMNEITSHSKIRKLQPMLIRPSQDLGAMAKEFLEEVPYHLRQMLTSTANKDELGDLLSYLMFSPGYVRALMELGRKDAATNHESFEVFLKDIKRQKSAPAAS